MSELFIQSLLNKEDSTFGTKSYEDDRQDFWDNILPPVIKRAYNQSITGMVDASFRGKERFDMPNFNPSIAQDFTAAALGFIMPLDIFATFVPGGIAAKAARSKLLLEGGKSAPKTRATKFLMKKGNFDKETANKIVGDVFEYGAFNTAAIGSYDGFYAAAKAGSDEILKQGISLKNLEDKSEEEILSIIGKEGMKGLFKGASLGAISSVARAMRWTGGYGGIPLVGKFKGTEAGGFLNEAVAFGAAAPLFEGRIPRGQDFILAGATFGALKAGPTIKKALGSFGQAVRKPIGDRGLSEGPIDYTYVDSNGQNKTITLDTTDAVASFGAKALTEDVEQSLRSVVFQPVLGREFASLKKEINEKLQKQPIFFSDDAGTSAFLDELGPDVLEKIQKATSLEATQQSLVNVVKKEKGLGTVREFTDQKSGKIALGGMNEVRIQDFIKDSKGAYTGEIRIRIGDNVFYKLDAKNTEKFFKHYTSNESIIKQFNKLNNKKSVDELHTVALKNRIKETSEEDLALAVNAMDAQLYGPDANRPVRAGVNVDKLTPAEKVFLNRQITGQKRYNEVYDLLSDIDKKNLTLQLENQGFWGLKKSKNENISPIGAVMNGLKSGKYQLQTPGAKKLLRYFDVVDGDITTLQGERLTSFGQILDFDEMRNARLGLQTATLKNNQSWNDYIRGVHKKANGETGRPTYTLKADLEDVRFQSKIKRKIETTKGKEKAFHEKRKEAVDGLTRGSQFVPGRNIKTVEKIVEKTFGKGAQVGLLPRVYLEAKAAGIPVAPFVANFFPKKMKRDFIDVILDQDANVRKEIEKRLGKGKANFTESGTLSEGDMKAVDEVINAYFQRVREAIAGKGRGALSKKDLLDEAYLKLMTTTQARMPGASTVDVYNAVRVAAYNNTLKPYASLERRRKTAVEKVSDIDFVQFADDLATSENFPEIASKELGQLTDALIESDGLVALSDYIVGASKRQVLGGTFGARGEVLDKLIDLIPEDAALSGRLRLLDTAVFSAPQTERQALELIKDVITGEVNFTQQHTAADVFRTASNLEMITKINLGFATIPNLTQTFISTAADAGYWRTIKGIHKLATDREFRKRVTSFTTLQTLVDDMVGVDPGTQTIQSLEARSLSTRQLFFNLISPKSSQVGGQSKVDSLLRLTDNVSMFSKVNRMNQMIAGATAEVMMTDLRALAKGKKGSGGFSFLDKIAPEKRIRYAKNRLQTLGFNMDEVLKDGYFDTEKGRKELARIMNKYSRDTQLQRSFEKDNILFNHPDFKPFLLFKRFGYRQAQFSYNLVKREWLNGNVMPIFALGASGIAGMTFVQPAKEALSAFLTGDLKVNDFAKGTVDEAVAKRFTTRAQRVRFLRDGFGGVTFEKYLESLGAVGGFGMIGDFAASDNPWNTLKFIATPVFFSDFNRVLKATETFFDKAETFYPSLYEPALATAIEAGPILGGVPARFLRRFETPKMEIDRYKQRKRETVRLARDLQGQGKGERAASLVDDYNRSIGVLDPSLVIGVDDFSIWKVFEDISKRQKRLDEEYQTLEDKMFEKLLA